MRLLVIGVDGHVTAEDVHDIDSMETIVGGTLEAIAWLDEITLMVCGCTRNKQYPNPVASRILWAATGTRDAISGEYILVGADREDFFNVSPRWVSRLAGHITTKIEEDRAI